MTEIPTPLHMRPARPLMLPGFISAVEVGLLVAETEGLPARRVVCGTGQVSWAEQSAPPGSRAFQFFASSRLKTFVLSQFPRGSRAKDPIVWRSTYRTGEYIDRHTDGSGDIQLLVSIAAPPVDCGGVFCAEVGHRTDKFILRPGDAILFKAHEIPHFTTPLTPSATCPNPRRVVIVFQADSLLVPKRESEAATRALGELGVGQRLEHGRHQVVQVSNRELPAGVAHHQLPNLLGPPEAPAGGLRGGVFARRPIRSASDAATIRATRQR